MITPAFSLTATERVLPRMALDFTTASLDSRVTFTRTGNTATVTNSSGYVVPINADLPRFDYDPVALTCKGLLIEELRTNLISYSEELDNVVWNPNNAPTIVANDGTSPGNTVTADSFLASGALSGVYRAFTVVSGLPHTFSIYLKYVSGGTGARVGCDANPANGYIDVNTQTGAITAVGASVTSSSTQNVGNGWFRVTGTYTTTTVATILILYGMAATNKFLAWGFQLEAGAFATSYIPTVASQVTRTADTATMTGTNFSSWYNASEGAFVASAVIARQATIGSTAIFSANDTTATNFINCFYRGSGALGVTMTAASVSQLDQTPLGVTVANTIVNIGMAYKVSNTVSYANGTVQTSTAALAIPTITQLQIGVSFVGVYLNGYVKNLKFYKQRILNAEGQAFSK